MQTLQLSHKDIKVVSEGPHLKKVSPKARKYLIWNDLNGQQIKIHRDNKSKKINDGQ